MSQEHEEMIPVVDKKDNIVGKMSRNTISARKGRRSRAVSILSFKSRKKEHVLIQKRSEDKNRKPGLYEITAGHVQLGESYECAAIREYAEELYNCEPEQLPFKPELEYEFSFTKDCEDNPQNVTVFSTTQNYDLELADEVAYAEYRAVNSILEDINQYPERYTNCAAESLEKYAEQSGLNRVDQSELG